MKKSSLGNRLICLFCITSLLPILIMGFFLYYRSVDAIRENTRKLSDINAKQVDDNLNILLESYGALLYQVYTNDDIVGWTDNLNAGRDRAVTVSQMRRYIRGILNSRDYIKSITIMADNGTVISCDKMMTSTTDENSWMERYSIGKEDFYKEIIADYQTHIFPTEYATTFSGEDHYLFHIAHRIIDYKNLEKQCGIAVLSIDAALLQEICLSADEKEQKTNFNFIVDGNGRLIFYDDFSQIGKTINQTGNTDAETAYLSFLKEDKAYEEENILISIYEDTALGWNIVGVTNQEEILQEIRNQLWIAMAISLCLFMFAIMVMIRISGQLVRSVQSIVMTMKKSESGDISNRVEVTKEMPIEMEEIAVAFNDMLGKLDAAIRKEKKALERQKDAEIKALEAQINPHFLYNTLDTVNWMAIDRNAFDISNAITSLAYILRYAIVDSGKEVTVAEETEWLKKYVYLQQIRLKERFSCEIQVEPDIQECRIHKLLLQPFVENSILHGFKDGKENHVLRIAMKKEQERLKIVISDNGIGIPEETLRKLQKSGGDSEKGKYYIGMQNAMMRLDVYYGGAAEILIESAENEGTEVRIYIPYLV